MQLALVSSKDPVDFHCREIPAAGVFRESLAYADECCRQPIIIPLLPNNPAVDFLCCGILLQSSFITLHPFVWKFPILTLNLIAVFSIMPVWKTEHNFKHIQ